MDNHALGFKVFRQFQNESYLCKRGEVLLHLPPAVRVSQEMEGAGSRGNVDIRVQTGHGWITGMARWTYYTKDCK